jgi:GAF domain-containing protein
MATFLSMPMRVRGRVVGVLALSSATKSAFGEASLNTLRLVEGPAAIVVDNARLSSRASAPAG